MFCGKCGNRIPDGQKHCAYCNPLTPDEPNFNTQQNNAWGTDPVFGSFGQTAQGAASQGSSFQVNTPVKTPKAKKGKGGKGILAIVAVVLVAVVALGAIFWGNISRFFQRNFGDPSTYLKDVEKDSISAAANDIATAYDQALANAAIENPAADYAISLELSDNLAGLVQTVLANEGMDVDLSWLDNVVLTPHIEQYDNTLLCDIGVGLNNTNLATLSMILDLDDYMIYIGVPELHSEYLAIDAYDFLGSEIYTMEESLAASQELTQVMLELLPDSQTLQELIVKYSGIIIDGLGEAEKEKRTVEVGDLEQDLLVVSVELSQKDILNIAMDVLKEVKKDKTIKKLLQDMDAFMEDYSGYSSYLYDDFIYALEDALEDIDYSMDDASSKAFLTIDSYMDSKDNVVGHTFTVKQDGEKVSINYITVTEGDEWAFEAELAEVYIYGSGTVNGDSTSGSYTLCVSGTDYVTLELEDCVTTESGFTGTLRLIPESSIYDTMALPAAYASLLDRLALALTVTNDSVTLAIETGGSSFLALTLSGEISEAKPISLPAYIDANDDEAGMQWLSELDLDAVVSNLSKAGLPNEYMEAVEQLVDMFHSQF